MPNYIVFVMPPKDEDAKPFDIPEWDFGAALATSKRYREHGWKACIIDYGTPFKLWWAKCATSPTINIMARTFDEAVIRARIWDENYNCFQRED